MRRVLGLLTALAAAAALTVLTGVGGAAASPAATGTLYVSNIPYANPSGCHNGAGMRIHVHNDTDATIYVHPRRDCLGPVIAQVWPGEARVVLGQSVSVG